MRYGYLLTLVAFAFVDVLTAPQQKVLVNFAESECQRLQHVGQPKVVQTTKVQTTKASRHAVASLK